MALSSQWRAIVFSEPNRSKINCPWSNTSTFFAQTWNENVKAYLNFLFKEKIFAFQSKNEINGKMKTREITRKTIGEFLLKTKFKDLAFNFFINY
jgi:hypothetical protein